MTAQKTKRPDNDIPKTNRKISRKPERSRKEAAAAKISPAMPPAGAALLADVDPALTRESETAASARRATGRDRMTGEK
jgi:hypothetical protein